MADQLMSVPELARFFGVPVSVIYGMRHRGDAPPAVRIGRQLRWRAEDVERWLEDRLEEAS